MIATHTNLAADASAKTVGFELQSRKTRLLNLILGDNPRQRATISFLLVAVLVFFILLYAMEYGITANLFDPLPMQMVALCWLISACVFYAIFRSGLNLRLQDKTLSLVQTCVAQTVMAFAYTCAGEAHGGILPMLCLIMVFGMFNMKPRATYMSCLYTVVLMGVMMLYKTSTDPFHFQPAVEWIYFVLTATALITIAQLSVRLNTLRARLKFKKTELEKAYLHIQELATHDELTGLYNRRELKNLFEQHVERQARSAQDFYLAMIDIDHFKIVNDTYGHHTGDEVLKNLSTDLSELLRKTDTIGRWGGEEFLLLLPDTGKDQVPQAMGRLLDSIVGKPMTMYPPLFISFSTGLTKYRPGENIEQTIRRADQLLYVAKCNGRNQIVHDEAGQLAA